MNKTKDLYDETFDKVVKLSKKEIDKVIITLAQLDELSTIYPHTRVITDTNGNYVCDYIDGRYISYADVLGMFCKYNNIKLTIDHLTNDYILERR